MTNLIKPNVTNLLTPVFYDTVIEWIKKNPERYQQISTESLCQLILDLVGKQ